MDDPALDLEQHRLALEGLKRVNRLSRSAAIFWPALRTLLCGQPSDRPLRVLDIACGGGDVTRDIARRAQQIQSADPDRRLRHQPLRGRVFHRRHQRKRNVSRSGFLPWMS